VRNKKSRRGETPGSVPPRRLTRQRANRRYRIALYLVIRPTLFTVSRGAVLSYDHSAKLSDHSTPRGRSNGPGIDPSIRLPSFPNYFLDFARRPIVADVSSKLLNRRLGRLAPLRRLSRVIRSITNPSILATPRRTPLVGWQSDLSYDPHHLISSTLEFVINRLDCHAESDASQRLHDGG
jgi:hypothetical protein